MIRSIQTSFFAKASESRPVLRAGSGFDQVMAERLATAIVHKAAAAKTGKTGATPAPAATLPSASASTDYGPGLAVLATPTPAVAAQKTTQAAGQAKTPDLKHVPTPEEVFGASPFMSNPQGQFVDGNNGQLRTYGFHPRYFATEAAAKQLAQQFGGTVVARNAICNDGRFVQMQPNYMLQLPNGREVNAGIVADFYNHGYPQSYVDRLIAREIDPDAGYDNLAKPVSTVINGVVQPGAYGKSYAPQEVS